MSVLLLFLLGLLLVVVLSMLASKVYPRATPKPEVQAEQELVGVGPESAKVQQAPKLLQGWSERH